MYLIRVMSAIICSLFIITSACAENRARAVYEKPGSAIEAVIKKELKTSDSIESVVTLINENFHLSEPLDIVFGGEEGPLYDSEENKILIPYSFVQEVKQRFIAANYSETGVSATDATLDALMHTLFHELAHALVFMYELPVVGKEEDAADGLATVLLIDLFEDGQEISISAADLFDLESEDIEEFAEGDFWDEHSLDIQRYYSTLCYVYGSGPNKYAYLSKQADFSQERAELCIEEYENRSKSWILLLKPYFKNYEVSQTSRCN